MDAEKKRPKGSDVKDLKDNASDSDSLEYSNDDQSENPKPETAADSKSTRPPTHPLGEGEKSVVVSTPDRRKELHGEQSGPGPLLLFSPGLSPIHQKPHIPNIDTAAGDVSGDDDGGHDEQAYIQALNSSMDSLEMASEVFPRDQDAPAEGPPTPNYHYWKNKLFGGDRADASFAQNIEENGRTTVGGAIATEAGMRSNDRSFDSDLHVTKQSLIYPTTDAVYARSRELDISLDSDVHAGTHSLVYPTTAGVYARSKVAELGLSPLIHQSLLQDRTLHTPTKHGATVIDEKTEYDDAREASRYRKRALKEGSLLLGQSLQDSFELGNISLLDATAHSPSPSFLDHDDHNHTLRSLSMLPGSPRQLGGSVRTQGENRRVGGVTAAAKRVAMVRPSAAAVRLKQLVGTSSDTEFVTSTSTARRRATAAVQAAGRGLQHARDTSDLRSPTPARIIPARTTTASVTAAPRAKPPPTVVSSSATKTRFRTPTQSAVGRPGSEPERAEHARRHEEQDEERPAATPATAFAATARNLGSSFSPSSAAAGGLVVGSLYTLLLDAQGRPTFVPVVGAQLPAPLPAQEMSAPAPPQVTTSQRVLFASTTPARPVVRHDPYRSNFDPPTSDRAPDPAQLYNSNGIDLEKVLDRALHRGSLSAERLKLGRNIDDAVAPSSGGGPQINLQPAVAPADALPGPRRSPSPAQYTKHTSRYSTPGVGGLPPKSPFQVGLSPDGKEQLLPSASYWKERLLARTLTSVLPAVMAEVGSPSPVRMALQ